MERIPKLKKIDAAFQPKKDEKTAINEIIETINKLIDRIEAIEKKTSGK